MKVIRIVLTLGICLPALAQPHRVMSGSASTGKASFTYETLLEPPSPPFQGHVIGGVVTGEVTNASGIHSEIHRYMAFPAEHKYIGYDISIEPAPQANTYQITFRPLSLGPEKMQLDDAAGYTILPLPVYPAPQTVHGGDTIVLDLLANTATGQKIVEYIHVQNQARKVYAASGTVRDFTVDDVELKIMEPHVSVNGQLLPATAKFTGGITGAAAWFYVPDHGRYVISLAPHLHLGFQKAGEIRGSSLALTIGGDSITLECNGPIAPGNAPYNVYVLYDASWLPKKAGDRTAFLMGSADTVESIVHR